MNLNHQDANLNNNQQMLIPVQGNVSDSPIIESNGNNDNTNPQTGVAGRFGQVFSLLALSLMAVLLTKKK